MDQRAEAVLVPILQRATRMGFLGPGPVEPHLHHSAAMAAAAGEVPRSFLDLGSGAGVPGLFLALEWPQADGVLLESQQRRCHFLEAAVVEAGISGRITVLCGRAEELARRPTLRGRFELVVARSFARPAVTAECAVGFLGAGGRLVVSDPPGVEGDPRESARWPAAGLAELGLTPAEIVPREGATFARLTAVGRPQERWPRRVGIPAKRPLWR